MCAMQKPTDPNMTLEVNNDVLENLLVRYSSEKNSESLNALITHLHTCRVLVPAELNDKKQPMPCFIKNSDGMIFLPMYTSKKQIPKEPKSPVIVNLPYPAVNQMVANPELKVSGIVINPFSNNLIFKKELTQKIFEIDQNKGKLPQTKEVQMTGGQYIAFERKQYEFRFLPKKLFGGGQEFIEELCAKKEEYIDALYEESYQEKRMYPYLPEEFSVMALSLSETVRIVRIDMPEREMADGACRRVFIAWDLTNEKGRYFTIEKAGKGSIFGEVTSDWRHVNLGEAPAEGAELQRILELLEEA